MDLGYEVHAVSGPADLCPATQDGQGPRHHYARTDSGSNRPRLDEKVERLTEEQCEGSNLKETFQTVATSTSRNNRVVLSEERLLESFKPSLIFP